MRFSQLLIPTLKETPSEAEVVSHQLLLRAGYIRKLSSGIYSYLPLGLAAIRKVERIVREEMNRAGARSCCCPWSSRGISGRNPGAGKNMARSCCVSPTGTAGKAASDRPMKR